MRPHEQLEKEFGDWAGVSNVVACSSGTAALHLALEALQLPPKSEVLVPNYTMVACPRAVVMAGLTPVFVDCGKDLLMDPDAANEAMTDSVSAVMLVHVYGRKCKDWWLDGHGEADPPCAVIEDMAEIHGATPRSESDAACWSFYRNKIVGGEEGGAVAWRDKHSKAHTEYLRCKRLRSLGFTEDHDYSHVPRGHNYRLADSLATKVLQSLRMYDWNLWARREIEMEYDRECPDYWKQPPRQAPWVYDLRIPGITRHTQKGLVKKLNLKGIEARMGFLPMTQQEEFKGCRRVGGEEADLAAEEVFYLPLTPGIDPRAREIFEAIRGMI